MGRRWGAVACGLVAGALLAPPAGAARPFSFEDPAGDAVGNPRTAGLDILRVTFATTGTVTRRKYVPTALVVTMTFNAAPPATAPFGYRVFADVTDCGQVWFTYTPGRLLGQLGGTDADVAATCGNTVFVTPVVRRNEIRFEVPLKDLPRAFRPGARFSELSAATDVGDPVFGAFGTGAFNFGPGAIDEASTTRTWVLS